MNYVFANSCMDYFERFEQWLENRRIVRAFLASLQVQPGFPLPVSRAPDHHGREEVIRVLRDVKETRPRATGVPALLRGRVTCSARSKWIDAQPVETSST